MASKQRRAYIVALIAAVTLVPVLTLTWLGWRLLDQDRMLEEQQIQERVEGAAQLSIAGIRQAVSDSRQRLAAGEIEWPEAAAIISFEGDQLHVYPRERVAYLPVVEALPEAPPTLVAEFDWLEFRLNDPAAAIAAFRDRADSDDAGVRAEALLRLGRALEQVQDIENALAAYAELSAIDSAQVHGTPAGLAGRYLRARIFENAGRAADLKTEAAQLQSDLKARRWDLTEPVYWLYRNEALGWQGLTDRAAATSAEIFASALDHLWDQRSRPPPSRSESLEVGDETLVILWDVTDESTHALAVTSGFVESEWLSNAVRLAQEQDVSLVLRDLDGRVVYGEAADDDLPRVDLLAQSTLLPWSLSAISRTGPGDDPTFARRRQLLIAGFALLVSMALAAGYLILRAVNRQLELARAQSDFVAAVSHEFRTPLTALRQFTDMLSESRNLDEDRRRVCYDAQSRATDRLTGLIESLLDFGRMEAGAHSYAGKPQDCVNLVRRTVEEFRQEPVASGYDIAFHANCSAIVEADDDALSRAVRNLLDNAVKYSPDRHEIQVGVEKKDGRVSIAIKDAGIGIPAKEREAIFSKFRRGEEARTRGIRGTGIGLAMVTEIVRAHAGQVQVESMPGVGSTFMIILPEKA